MISRATNSLKMAQGLQMQEKHDQAIRICQGVIGDVKPMCNEVDAMQIISFALGLISDSMEKIGRISHAVEYKRTQREFLEVIASIREETCEEVMSPGARKRQMEEKLEVLENMSLDTSSPKKAMEQIIASMEKAKRRRVKEAVESFSYTGKTRQQAPVYDSWIDWVLDHPVEVMFIVAGISGLFLFLLIMFLRHNM